MRQTHPVTKVKYIQTKSSPKVLRIGECNNCGVCCMIFKRPETPKGSLFYAETARYEHCKHYLPYGVSGHCSIYNKRPTECRNYPRGPMDVLNKPQCSFRFTDEHGRLIDAYMDKRVKLQIIGQTTSEDYPFSGKF